MNCPIKIAVGQSPFSFTHINSPSEYIRNNFSIHGFRRNLLDVILSGDRLLTCSADVSKIDDLNQMYDTVTKRFGKIDIVFANAGVGTFTAIEDCDEATLKGSFTYA